MTFNVRRFATVFGLCVTIASLGSGCATQVNRMPMSEHDLNFFIPDCKRKHEQVAMLQSMRQTSNEKMSAALTNMFQFWTAFSEPNNYELRQSVASGGINKQINWNLQHLKYCP
jgi:hypothetical protein